ncbi:hypothetical protein AVEN_11750-1 [Araneus ventricosus]|uniref:Uncharacterized protein n=1 Tax=Araneus ventricosus TaxID=182803 RepID=A0A4Y2EQS3_ARAVE|nr:hypothetical protein AVEN_11750-1 [Araneus ventricosus]
MGHDIRLNPVSIRLPLSISDLLTTARPTIGQRQWLISVTNGICDSDLRISQRHGYLFRKEALQAFLEYPGTFDVLLFATFDAKSSDFNVSVSFLYIKCQPPILPMKWHTPIFRRRENRFSRSEENGRDQNSYVPQLQCQGHNKRSFADTCITQRVTNAIVLDKPLVIEADAI